MSRINEDKSTKSTMSPDSDVEDDPLQKGEVLRNCMRITEEKRSARIRNRRVHMANERTFLAWIRTSIGIMAFGFVVEKFAIFIRQAEGFLGRTGYDNIPVKPPQAGHGYSTIFGILLVGLGALMGVLAFIRYKKVERQIDDDTYAPSLLLDILLTISICAIGIFLIIYLAHSIL